MRVERWKLVLMMIAVVAVGLIFVIRTQAAAPTITSLSLSSGAEGTQVIISGANFGSSEGTSTVQFNGTTAAVAKWTTGRIVAIVPAGATSGKVVVIVSGIASNGVAFTVVAD